MKDTTDLKGRHILFHCILVLVFVSTDYGLDGPGIESWWGESFPPVQTGPGAHPASCTMGTGSFPGVKYGRGVLLTTHPLLVPWSWKGRAIPLPTLWATTAPVTGTLYLYCSLFTLLTYLFTYLLTYSMEQESFLEKLTGSQIFKKFPVFY